MIKERIPTSGDLKSKVKQLMEYAGWQEGRNVDISIAEQYYADHGVPMMKTTQRFYRKYFGLCCEWYREQKMCIRDRLWECWITAVTRRTGPMNAWGRME